jgi:putative oxidoreductase
MSAGLLIVRLVFGGLFAVHGTQKLFGWFGGYGPSGTGTFLETLGFRPGLVFAAAGLAEFGGGLLFVFGLLEPVASATIISIMLVAIATVHLHNGLLAISNGIEVPLLYATAAASVALTGPGDYSLDAVFGLTSWWTIQLTSIALTAGVLGGFAGLGMRRQAAAVAHP